MSKEFEYTPSEVLFPSPSSAIRPHHLYLKWVQEALVSQIPPDKIAKRVSVSFEKQREFKDFVYFSDVVGTSIKERRTFAGNLTRSLTALRNMADTEVLNITPENDPICRSCIVGIHCQASNYVDAIGSMSSAAEAENIKLVRIRESLLDAGFKERQHFVISTTSITVEDRGRKGLLDPIVAVRQEEAYSMQALIGPIRSLIRQGKLPPK